MIFKRNRPEAAPANVHTLRELALPGDIINELTLADGRNMTTVEADEFFRRLGAAITNMRAPNAEDKWLTTVLIEGVVYDVTLRPFGNENKLSLAVTKHH